MGRKKNQKRSEDRLAKALVERSLAFHRRRVWLDVEDEDSLVIEVPEVGAVVASIMGWAGEEYGLNLILGESALDDVLDLRSGFGHDEDALERIHQIGVTVDTLGAIPGDMRGILEAAQFRGRREVPAPFFIAKSPGEHPRLPNRREQRTLLFAINAVLAAAEQGDLKLVGIEGGRVLTLALDGTAFEPTVKARVKRVKSRARTGAPEQEHRLPADLRDLPRTSSRWIVGRAVLPGRINGDSRTVNVLVVVDRDRQLVVNAGIFLGNDLSGAGDVLVSAMNGDNAVGFEGLPEFVGFGAESLFDGFAKPLRDMGIETAFEPEDDLLQSILEDLHESALGRGTTHGGGGGDELGESTGFARYRALDDAVTHSLIAEMKRRGRSPDRAMRKYFGSKTPDDLGELAQAAEIAFFDWLLHFARPTPRSKTIAELVLARKRLRPDERQLIEARVAAVPSFYRIESAEAGESVTMTDVFNGESVVVHDRSLSLEAQPETVLIARVYPAGPFRFCSLAGPPFHVVAHEHVVDFLERQGLWLPGGLAERPQLLGRLWGAIDGIRKSLVPKRLANSDGEDLRWHRLSYEVTDEGEARAKLVERDDVDVAADDGIIRWLKPARAGWAGDEVTAATLEFIGNELIVEVNSVQRAEAVRSMLDAIPGLSFREITEATGADASADGALPTLGEGPPDEAVLEAIQEIMHTRHREWLDESIPALGGMTPRQACATESGRSRVRQLILTMPAARGPGGAHIPPRREELLRELSLDDGEA